MMSKCFFAFALAMVLAFPASAETQSSCYGRQDQALAQKLLKGVPGLRHQIQSRRAEALSLRHDACAVVAQLKEQAKAKGKKGKKQRETVSVDIDSMYFLSHDPSWKLITTAAEARRLNPYAVFAATIDSSESLPPALFFFPSGHGGQKKLT